MVKKYGPKTAKQKCTKSVQNLSIKNCSEHLERAIYMYTSPMYTDDTLCSHYITLTYMCILALVEACMHLLECQ